MLSQECLWAYGLFCMDGPFKFDIDFTGMGY